MTDVTSLICEEVAECRFPADLRFIAPAMEKMRLYTVARGLRPRSWLELELAVTEALNNAVEHGCLEDPALNVHLRWKWDGDKIEVEVSDPGDFQPSMEPAALPEDLLSEGGRGAFLMARLVDSVEHGGEPGHHHLRLTKVVGLPTWQPGDAAEMDKVIESMAEELSRSYEDLSAVFRFAEELGTSETLDEFLQRAFARLLDLIEGEAVYLRLHSKDGSSLELMQSGARSVTWAPIHLALEESATEAAVFHTREAATLESCRKLPESDPLHAYGGSAFVCPVFFQSKTLGCLVMARRAGLPYFSAGELGLIRVVADFLGIACTTSTLQEQRQQQQRALRELEIAASIQQSLLPRTFPDDPPYLVYGVCHSATQVGGDYFDVLAVEDGILLVIADVMGKGVPAALLASIFRTAVHARRELVSQPERLLTEVNRQICPDLAHNGMFITAQLAWLSRSENSVLVANAGHCPMLHLPHGHSEWEALAMGSAGLPLGVLDDEVYRASRHDFAPGDRLVLLTDGLYEVENPAEDMLNVPALIRQMAAFSHESPQSFCASLLAWVTEYSGSQTASDDRTLLVVERLSR